MVKSLDVQFEFKGFLTSSMVFDYISEYIKLNLNQQNFLCDTATYEKFSWLFEQKAVNWFNNSPKYISVEDIKFFELMGTYFKE